MRSTIDEESRNRIACHLGLFLQAVAALELALDDLVSLAEDRMNISRYIKGREYPASMNQKLTTLRLISERVGYSALPKSPEFSIRHVLDARNWVAHGKVIAVIDDESGYEIRLSKQGKLPKRINGVQTIVRDQRSFKRSEFAAFASEIRKVNFDVTAVSKKVFSRGEGWPNYMVLPEGDPLGVDEFYRVMA